MISNETNQTVVVNANQYLDEIAYLPSVLINVAYLPFNCSNNALSKTVSFGDESVSVSLVGDVIPSGMYPRRFISYLSTIITRTRLKNPTVKIAKNRTQFYKDALGVNYIPSSKDVQAINTQLRALIESRLTISYSNPNDKSRKPKESISLLDGDYSWLYDDKMDWQYEIKLSQEMFELIKSTVVPISGVAMKEFNSARKLDIFNYLMYQNYNLFLKKLTGTFRIEELHNLFGGESSLNEFRRILNRTLEEIRDIIPIQFTAKNKFIYVLEPTQDCLLVRHKRKLTNVVNESLTVINEDYKDKLKKDYSDVDVEASCVYLAKRIQMGHIRHPHAYLRDILKNPKWYQQEKICYIQNIHKMQYHEYENLPPDKLRINKSYFRDFIKQLNILSVPYELQEIVRQFKNPGQKIVVIPGFEYCSYLFWAFMHNKVTTTNTSIEGKIIELFRYLTGGN